MAIGGTRASVVESPGAVEAPGGTTMARVSPTRRAVCLLAVAAVGCGGERDARAPVARIDGASLRAGYGTLVTLDGSRSSGAGGHALRYRWRIVSGPDVASSIRRSDRPRFTFRTAPASELFAL